MAEERVRRARIGNIPHILRIQDMWGFSKLEDASSGFLVHTLPGEEVEGLIGVSGKHLWVYDSSGRVGGYLIAYDKSRWLEKDESMLTARFLGGDGKNRRIIESEWLYGRHIARHPEAEGKVPFALENALFNEARSRGIPYAVAEIATGPGTRKHNAPSLIFNVGKMGWKTIGQRDERDEALNLQFVWQIIAKNLKACNKT